MHQFNNIVIVWCTAHAVIPTVYTSFIGGYYNHQTPEASIEAQEAVAMCTQTFFFRKWSPGILNALNGKKKTKTF